MLSLIILLFWTPEAGAAGKVTQVFTALGTDSRGHFVAGVMRRTGGFEPFSKLVSIHPRTFKKSVIPLPRDANDREVIAIVQGARQLLVLTQQTVEQGDNPTLYGYDRKKKAWRKVGEVACPVIEKANVEKDRLVFQCEKETEAGSFISAQEVLPLKGEQVSTTGELRINPDTAISNQVSAALEGDEDARHQLRIRTKKSSRVLRP